MKFFFAGVAVLTAQSALADLAESPDGHIMDILLPASVAQNHPERYADLQIRVCGWNVRWNDLSKVEQDHFIATAEAQEN